jgi:MurNAc alpha-1-phosphate uridylyltransferase
MKCMILAAGYGKRMMPLTKETPKPLLKIGNETLLDRNIKHVLSNGFDEIIINVSHHGDKIKEHLIENYKDHKITLVEEPHPYGTGGALINARDHLGDETILIINADIFHDFDLSKLNRETEYIHLVGVENPDHNTDGDFNIGPDGKVSCDDINQLTWSGISLLNAEILSKIDNYNFPFDSWSGIVLPQIMEEKVTGEIYSDIWLDVGTKDRLELANKILREEN